MVVNVPAANDINMSSVIKYPIESLVLVSLHKHIKKPIS